LGVERVEGERGLARARQAGDHDELLARQLKTDVLEVVRARAADAYFFQVRRPGKVNSPLYPFPPAALQLSMLPERMTPAECRAGSSLSAIFGLRMRGLFFILPVFAVHAPQYAGGGDLMLVGIALGAYGLTQAILQIPFGMASDRWGRKPVIYAGLLIFAGGS